MTPRTRVQLSLLSEVEPIASEGEKVFRCEVCRIVAVAPRDAVACAACGGQIVPTRVRL